MVRPWDLRGSCLISFPPITLSHTIQAGRLSLYVQNWKRLTPRLLGVSWYKIANPTQQVIRRTVVSKEEDAYSEEVQSLLKKGMIVQVQ